MLDAQNAKNGTNYRRSEEREIRMEIPSSEERRKNGGGAGGDKTGSRKKNKREHINQQ